MNRSDSYLFKFQPKLLPSILNRSIGDFGCDLACVLRCHSYAKQTNTFFVESQIAATMISRFGPKSPGKKKVSRRGFLFWRVCRQGPENNQKCLKTRQKTQGPLNGGVSKGGVSRSGLVLAFLSFFCPFGTSPIFLGFSRFALPICPFPLSRPIKSTYEEQS